MSLFILLRFLLGCLENPDLENSDLRPKNPDPPNLENSDPPPPPLPNQENSDPPISKWRGTSRDFVANLAA